MFRRHPFWNVIVQPNLAAAACAVAREIAGRLQDDELVKSAAERLDQQSLFSRRLPRRPFSVAGGSAGLAILFAHLDNCFPTEGWDVVGHHHLLIAVKAAEEVRNLPLGLFAGWSGVAFATWFLSRGGSRYRKLLAALDKKLLPEFIALPQRLEEQRQGFAVEQFDLVSGLAGIGAYLLCRQEDPEVAGALQSTLQSLVNLTREEGGVPYWHTPASLMSSKAWKIGYPDGYLNCGLAHGIPGPLVVLALAKSWRREVPGIAEALERTASWLLAHREDDAWGINWPFAVAVGRFDASFGSTQPYRTAWCYGLPGVARSLWLAGEALDSSSYREIAITAMKGIYQRPLAVRCIDSPTFCHGVAGLLQVTLRFAHDTGDPLFYEAANTLTEQILSLYEPDTLLGYRHKETGENYVDQVSLLEGAAGVVLVLLAASTPKVPAWDRLFLLS